MQKQGKSKLDSYWCFGLINNGLAEIFFERGKILGHCYVKESEYKTKQEKRWIREDTERVRLTYRKGIYRVFIYSCIDNSKISAIIKR